MQDVELQQLVIPLPKRRRVAPAAPVPAAPPAEPPHNAGLTCASLVSMYLPVPPFEEPRKQGLFEDMVHKVLSRRVGEPPELDMPRTLPLADDPCAVVAGMIILTSQTAVVEKTSTATTTSSRPQNTFLSLMLDSEQDQSSTTTVKAREVPLLPPELSCTNNTGTALRTFLKELSPVVPAVSVNFDSAPDVVQQQLTHDLKHTLSTPQVVHPSFVSLLLDETTAQHEQLQEMEVPVVQVNDKECIGFDLHVSAVLSVVLADIEPLQVEEHAETSFLTPSTTFEQLLCEESRLQTSVPMPTNDLVLEQQLFIPQSRPNSVETIEEPLVLLGGDDEACLTLEVAQGCRPCSDNNSPPELPLAEQTWSMAMEKDMVPPWSTVARLFVPELPEVFLQSHNLTNTTAIATALLPPEQEQTALRQHIELSLLPFWSSSRMTALKQTLCLRGINTSTRAPETKFVHPTAADVFLRREAMLVTDVPASQNESTLALVHKVPPLPSPGKLSASPLENFMRLRGHTPRKVESQPLPVPAPVTTAVPFTLQSSVTPWHVCSFHCTVCCGNLMWLCAD